MYYVTAQIKDGTGAELQAKDCAGHNLGVAMLTAQTWALARLEEVDDPNAYAEYSASDSKPVDDE